MLPRGWPSHTLAAMAAGSMCNWVQQVDFATGLDAWLPTCTTAATWRQLHEMTFKKVRGCAEPSAYSIGPNSECFTTACALPIGCAQKMRTVTRWMWTPTWRPCSKQQAHERHAAAAAGGGDDVGLAQAVWNRCWLADKQTQVTTHTYNLFDSDHCQVRQQCGSMPITSCDSVY